LTNTLSEQTSTETDAALKVLITGANGYLGREVVRQCLIAGHRLILVVRDQQKCPVEWQIDQRITLTEADLFDIKTLPDADVICHLAAAMSGPDAIHQRDTVEATRAVLIAALRQPEPPAFVLASSMSVYGTEGLHPGDHITEASPLEEQADLRDTYCRAKLGQELLCSTAAADAGLPLQVLRIGALWGATRLWNAHLGHAAGPVLLRMETAGDVPIAHIRHAAQALRLAAESAASGQSGVINVLDSDLPTRQHYINALRQSGWPRLTIPLHWSLMALVARMTKSRMRPGLLRLPTLRARMLPLHYDNSALRQHLGWQPEADFDTLMAEAIAARPPQQPAREVSHD
jgi:nucleoside-diphosphate-sugar epimerase